MKFRNHRKNRANGFYMSMRLKAKQAFTLVELLLVASLFSVICLAIYATFNKGIDIWQAVNRETVTEGVNIFYDKISADLRNGYVMSGMRLTGSKHSLTIPAFVMFSGKKCPGLVTYSFDQSQKVLSREVRNYSQVYRDKKGPVAELVKGVEAATFHYYYDDPPGESYHWSDSWPDDDFSFLEVSGEEPGLPLAVRVSVKVKDRNLTDTFTRTVSIPVTRYSRNSIAE